MRVASLFLHPFSGSLGSTVRVRELAISLSKLGVGTYIFSPYEKEQLIDDSICIKHIPNVVEKFGLSQLMYHLSRFAYYNSFFIQKIFLNEKIHGAMASRLAKGMLKILRDDSVDVVQAEQDIAIFPCLKLSDLIEAPVVVDLHNITSEELVAAGVIRRGSQQFRALQQLMKDALSQVDLVVVVSEEMRRYVISEYGLESHKVTVVPPGGRPRVENLDRKILPPKVVYAGLVTYREHVDLFVRSMPFVIERLHDARFYMTDRGENLKRVRGIARRLGVNPEFFWYPNENDFYEFLASMHIGVLPSSNDSARRMGTPVKLFDYLSVGLPVVANDIGAWTEIIRQEVVGVVTKGDPDSFADGIITLLEDVSLYNRASKKALMLIREKYNWDISARTLFERYRNLG